MLLLTTLLPVPVLLIKLLIALALLIVSGLLWLKKPVVLEVLKKMNTKQIFVFGWLIFRLAPFLIIYLSFNIYPTSDVIFYWDEVSKAAYGEIIYRDFFSPYSPFFVYFLAIWLKIWYHPKMIILVMAMMDGLALLLANRFYQKVLNKEERMWRILMYFVLPGALMFCIIGGQEDVWIWLFALLACIAGKQKNNVVMFSLLLAFGILMTKAIFILVIIPFFLVEKKKLLFALPIAIVGVVSFGVLYSMVGWEFLQPLDEAKILRAPNVLSVVNPVLFNSIGVGADFWNWLALLLTVAMGVVTLHKFRNEDFQTTFSRFWVVLFGTMMTAQQSAYSGYLYLFLMPLVFYVIDWENKRQVLCLFLFNLLCVLHPTLWWRSGLPKYTRPAEIFTDGLSLLDYAMQVTIVILTIYFIRLGFCINSEKKVTILSDNTETLKV